MMLAFSLKNHYAYTKPHMPQNLALFVNFCCTSIHIVFNRAHVVFSKIRLITDWIKLIYNYELLRINYHNQSLGYKVILNNVLSATSYDMVNIVISFNFSPRRKDGL